MTSPAKPPLPPGPHSWFPGAIFRDLRRGPLDFLTRLTRQYGDVSSFRAAGQRYVVINHPDLARDILLTQADAFWKGPALQNSKGILGEGLLTAEGESHRRQRKLMQPAFHARAVEQYAREVVQGTAELLARWGTHPAERDIRPDMMGLTLVIAGRALFGTMLEGDVAMVHRCMDDLMNNYVRAVVPWGKLLNYLPLASTRKLQRAQADLQALVDRMISDRRAELAAGAAGRRDLLTMLIAATDADAAPGAGFRLTDTQLRDQAITLLTAGHETTANAMSFTLHLLARHPAEQALLRDEARRVLGDSAPTPDLLDRLVRTRWVLSESMRLFPPAWTIGRQNQHEVVIGGFRLPCRCTILIPQWTLHRDPRFWPDPLEFRPDRWRDPSHPRFAYIPFSTGPRNCIGESFAWMEMLLALAMILRDYQVDALSQEPLALTPAITLRPKHAVMLRVSAAPP